MIFIWKNKGILVPVYIVATFISMAILSGILERNVGGIFAYDYDTRFFLALVFFISGTWTYLTSEEFIKKDGRKIKVDVENKFFFIPMKIWGYIFLGLGLLFLINALTTTL